MNRMLRSRKSAWMYEGDRSRKTVLVNYGFRLPSALDNRPFNFDEFMKMTNQIIYVSATPAEFEIQNSVVGNKGYIPHRRQRIGEAELVPFAVAGGKRPTPKGFASRPPNAQPRLRRGRAPPWQASNVQFRNSDFENRRAAGEIRRPHAGCAAVVEQIIRPTGLLDPKITLKPLKNQIDETIELCRQTGGKS